MDGLNYIIALNETKISFIIIFFTVFTFQSQVNTYSPYSYFGLGSIQNSNSTYFLSMGGLSKFF